MPVPKRKRSRRRRDSRFANKGIKVKAIATCANCAVPLIPHAACSGCGHYKGVKVLATKADRSEKRVDIRKARDERKAARQTTEPSEQQ